MTDVTALQAAPGGRAAGPLRWRRRLLAWLLVFVAVFVVCFVFAEPIFRFLLQPIATALAAGGYSDGTRQLAFTALTEVFFTYVTVALYAATFICFPAFLSHLWLLRLSAGGRRSGRAGVFGAAALVLSFVLGAATVYYLVYPMIMNFWITFQVPTGDGALPIQLQPMVGEYLSYLMNMILTGSLFCLLSVALVLWLCTDGGSRAAAESSE